MWENIVVPLQLADFMRERLGAPCRIASSYRSPAYNRKCPGAAPNSFHTKNLALDLQFHGINPVVVANAFRRWRTEGLFKGGIGEYETFVHIDNRGSNASW